MSAKFSCKFTLMSSVAKTKRGPYAGTRRRRETIARAVLDLVHEVGHESVTIAQVAERSGSSEATVLYHFPSRDHLLVAALELDDRSAVTRSHLDADSVLSLEQFHDMVATASRSDPILRLLFTVKGQAASTEHPAWAYLEQRNAMSITIFTQLIAGRQREGLAHPGLDPRQIAIQLIAMWDGLTSLWFTGIDFDLADMLVDATRRLSGENVMEARAMMRAREFGL